MKQMVCTVCSYTYDEAKGIPEAGIPSGTRWEDLPEDWRCPWCKAGKEAFREKQESAAEDRNEHAKKAHAEQEVSAMEMSIICSNLARGCEKQYLLKEAEGFSKLADFFRGKAEPVSGENGKILELIEHDLSVGYPYANETALKEADRGALRSLVWSEKVTRMLQSLLKRYETEGERMLDHTGVWVCTICGFVYIGDQAPDLCPVCKVAGWKFEKVEGRA